MSILIIGSLFQEVTKGNVGILFSRAGAGEEYPVEVLNMTVSLWQQTGKKGKLSSWS